LIATVESIFLDLTTAKADKPIYDKQVWIQTGHILVTQSCEHLTWWMPLDNLIGRIQA
jgi:hypothetical protein